MGVNTYTCHVFQLFICKTFKYLKSFFFFFINASLFVGLHKTPVECVEVCICSVARYGRGQRVWTLMCTTHHSNLEVWLLETNWFISFQAQISPRSVLSWWFKPNYPLHFGITATMRTATSSVSGRSVARSNRRGSSSIWWALPCLGRWSVWNVKQTLEQYYRDFKTYDT